ncbi:MAG: DUF1311 domain-containing protein [Sphingomonadales bacterium]|nr:MAG: DUF1311 domain-containing protein [Sphingomonadales bacterium]
MTIAIALAIAFARAVDPCASAETTLEIVDCVSKLYEVSDARMTVQWERAVARAKLADSVEPKLQPTYFAALLDSQRKWLAYRDSQCRYESYRMRGGSGERYTLSFCLVSLTDQRADQLRSLEF